MRRSGQMKPCSICGTEVYRKAWKLRDRPTVYCSRLCYEVWWKANRPFHQIGSACYNWKGGKIERECRQCHVKFFVGRNHLSNTRNFCSVTCMGGYYTGSRSHLWKGGVSSERGLARRTPEYATWRLSVYRRDHFLCVLCLKHERLMDAHHIKQFFAYPELRYDVENGVTLCRYCHSQIRRMEPEFENVLRSRILRDFTSDTRVPLDVVKIKSVLRSDVQRLAEMPSPVALLA